MMKMNIASGNFAKAMKIARKLVPSKPSLPAYSYVQLFKKEDDYYLRAQDNEIVLDIRADFELTGGNFEEVGLPVAGLSDMLNALPEQPLSIVFEEKQNTAGGEKGGIMEVTYENGHYSLPYCTAEDFPIPIAMEESVEMVIPVGVVCGAMRTAMAHVANDVLRPVMNTVALDITGDRYTVVASDGHRMFVDEYLGGIGKDRTMMALISARMIAMADSAIALSSDPTVRLVTDGKRLSLVGDGFVLQSKLAEGRYPNYHSVIPQNQSYSVTFEKKALLSAIRRVSLMGNPNSSLICIEHKDGEFRIKAQDVDFSTSASEKLSPTQEKDVPEGFRIGFKGDFLTCCLNSLESEEIQFFLTNSSVATVMREVNGKKERLALLMPMMLNEEEWK